jgi:hypothetical protein
MEHYYVSLFLQKEAKLNLLLKKRKKVVKGLIMLEGSESRETYQKEAACIVFYCQNFISYFLNAKVDFEKKKKTNYLAPKCQT